MNTRIQQVQLRKANDHIEILNLEKETLKRMMQKMLTQSTSSNAIQSTNETEDEQMNTKVLDTKRNNEHEEFQKTINIQSKIRSNMTSSVKRVNESRDTFQAQGLIESLQRRVFQLEKEKKEASVVLQQLESLKIITTQLEEDNNNHKQQLESYQEYIKKSELIKDHCESFAQNLSVLQFKIDEMEKEKNEFLEEFQKKSIQLTQKQNENDELLEIISQYQSYSTQLNFNNTTKQGAISCEIQIFSRFIENNTIAHKIYNNHFGNLNTVAGIFLDSSNLPKILRFCIDILGALQNVTKHSQTIITPSIEQGSKSPSIYRIGSNNRLSTSSLSSCSNLPRSNNDSPKKLQSQIPQPYHANHFRIPQSQSNKIPLVPLPLKLPPHHSEYLIENEEIELSQSISSANSYTQESIKPRLNLSQNESKVQTTHNNNNPTQITQKSQNKHISNEINKYYQQNKMRIPESGRITSTNNQKQYINLNSFISSNNQHRLPETDQVSDISNYAYERFLKETSSNNIPSISSLQSEIGTSMVVNSENEKINTSSPKTTILLNRSNKATNDFIKQEAYRILDNENDINNGSIQIQKQKIHRNLQQQNGSVSARSERDQLFEYQKQLTQQKQIQKQDYANSIQPSLQLPISPIRANPNNNSPIRSGILKKSPKLTSQLSDVKSRQIASLRQRKVQHSETQNIEMKNLSDQFNHFDFKEINLLKLNSNK